MIRSIINVRSGGIFAILLILLTVNNIKSLFAPSKTIESACDRPSFIQMTGDVENPGVYAFCREVSLWEVLARADGISPPMGQLKINEDFNFPSGTRILLQSDGRDYFMTQKEMTAFHKVTLGIPISLNRESEEGLTAIPGVGPGFARAIVNERSKRGDFQRLDEVMTIKGIGQKLYARIQPYLKL